MKRAKIISYISTTMVAVFCLTLVLVTAQASQERQSPRSNHQKPVRLIHSLEGTDLFHAYCATCHGDTGKGDGPIASVLDTPVTDLTTLSRRNGGIFPAKRVRTIIAGDELIKAHGTREMPIWGPIFHQVERDRDFGSVRLQNVTEYVESLQQK